MNRNQKKFDEIQDLLIIKLGDRIECSQDEDGTKYLNIKNSDFWLSTTFGEFVVGFGLSHTHFSHEYENLDEGVKQVLELLTNRIKITEYIKGNTIYKTIIEVEYPNLIYKNIGESSLIFYPFWQKRKIKTALTEKIIDMKLIEKETKLIINS